MATVNIFGEYILPGNNVTDLGVYEGVTLEEAIAGELEFLNGMPGLISPFELERSEMVNAYTREVVYRAEILTVDEDGEPNGTEEVLFRAIAEEL